MEQFENLLLISGTSQNTGKTTLACEIIKAWNDKNYIVALKISPHFHTILPNDKIISDSCKFIVIEEIFTESGKDSARMLQAGAQKSYFIMSKDENVKDAFDFIVNILPSESMMVCESGGLAKYINSGLSLLLTRNHQTPKTASRNQKADMKINTDQVLV